MRSSVSLDCWISRKPSTSRLYSVWSFSELVTLILKKRAMSMTLSPRNNCWLVGLTLRFWSWEPQHFDCLHPVYAEIYQYSLTLYRRCQCCEPRQTRQCFPWRVLLKQVPQPLDPASSGNCRWWHLREEAKNISYWVFWWSGERETLSGKGSAYHASSKKIRAEWWGVSEPFQVFNCIDTRRHCSIIFGWF